MRTAVLVAVAVATVGLNASAQEEPGANEINSFQVVQIQQQIELLKSHKPGPELVRGDQSGQPAAGIHTASLSISNGTAMVQLKVQTTSSDVSSWTLRFACNSKNEKPTKALASIGITVPVNWEEMNNGAPHAALYKVPESDLPQVAQFVHELFLKSFKRPATYKIMCRIEVM